jgi:hypothetical protein
LLDAIHAPQVSFHCLGCFQVARIAHLDISRTIQGVTTALPVLQDDFQTHLAFHLQQDAFLVLWELLLGMWQA